MTDALRKAKAAERRAISAYRSVDTATFDLYSKAEFCDGLRARHYDEDGRWYARSSELWARYEAAVQARERAFIAVVKAVRLTERAKEGSK